MRGHTNIKYNTRVLQWALSWASRMFSKLYPEFWIRFNKIHVRVRLSSGVFSQYSIFVFDHSSNSTGSYQHPVFAVTLRVCWRNWVKPGRWRAAQRAVWCRPAGRPAVDPLSLSSYRDLPSAQLLLGSRCEQLSAKIRPSGNYCRCLREYISYVISKLTLYSKLVTIRAACLNMKEISALFPRSVFVFRIILARNTDYFPYTALTA